MTSNWSVELIIRSKKPVLVSMFISKRIRLVWILALLLEGILYFHSLPFRWTKYLLDQGLFVYSIDPSPLSHLVLSSDHCIHIRSTIEDCFHQLVERSIPIPLLSPYRDPYWWMPCLWYQHWTNQSCWLHLLVPKLYEGRSLCILIPSDCSSIVRSFLHSRIS